MKYQPPYGVSDPNAGYVNGNPSEGIAGSIPPAQSIEFPMREVVNLIQKGGHVPNDNDLYQLTRSARRALYQWGIDTGSQNSLSVALDPALLAYASGLELRVFVAFDNTGPATIRVNGLSTQQILRKDGSSLLAGDLRQGGIAIIVHDGSNFQLVSGVSGNVTISSGWFNGADWIVDIGPANALQGTPPVAPAAYGPGLGYSVLVKNDNTGPITLNVGNNAGGYLGPMPVFLPNGQLHEAGDIVAGMVIRVIYDGTRFTMTSKIHMELIESSIKLIVGPNTGADFPDLNAAMAWLNRRRITNTGLVTFQLQGKTGGALQHVYGGSINIAHPDGRRLTIQGPGMNFVPTPGNFWSANWNFAGNAANNLGMLKSAFQAEIHFTRGDSTFYMSGRVGLVKDILVTGPAFGGAGNGGGIGIGGGGYVFLDTVGSAYSASTCFYIDVNSTMAGTNMYAVGSGVFAVGLAHASNLLVGAGSAHGGSGSFVIAQSYSDGIQAAHGAIMQFDLSATRPRIYDCSGYAINHWGASSLHCAYLFAWWCWNGGVATASAVSWLYGSQVSNCPGIGLLASTGAAMDCNTATISSNDGGDYVCAHGSFMYAAGFQIGSAQFSPARNTWGNGNAYIEG